MKKLITSLGLFAFISVLTLTQAVQAGVTITAQETGGKVVFTLSGSLNPGTPGVPEPFGPETILDPKNGDIEAWQTSAPASRYALASKVIFGTPNTFPNDGIGTGTNFAIFGNEVVLDASYTAGSAINSTLTFTGTTLSELGVTSRLDSYVWQITETGDTISMIFPAEIAAANAPLNKNIKKLKAKIRNAKRNGQTSKAKKLTKKMKKLQRQLLPLK